MDESKGPGGSDVELIPFSERLPQKFQPLAKQLAADLDRLDHDGAWLRFWGVDHIQIDGNVHLDELRLIVAAMEQMIAASNAQVQATPQSGGRVEPLGE